MGRGSNLDGGVPFTQLGCLALSGAGEGKLARHDVGDISLVVHQVKEQTWTLTPYAVGAFIA